VIDTNSVNSKNEGRDQTLVTHFFKQMSGDTINAKIIEVVSSDKHEKGKSKAGTLTAEITMNGVTKKVPMAYRYNDGVLNAEGVIDLFDFSANKALQSINKACYDLHSGKTWSDVAISFSTDIKATGCSSK
jgi:polyisoprenoid-binding protein YceI